MKSKYKLLSSKEFIKDAVKAVRHAKQTIYLISTIVNEDSATGEFLESIREAAKRGIKVFAIGDAYTFTEVGGHFSLSYQFRKRLRSVTSVKRSFEKNGARFMWAGGDTFTLLSGRTHSKWLIVDDTVYTFGGVNLYASGINNTDFMLKTTDPELARRLRSEQKRIVSAVKNRHAYRSHYFGNDTTRVLIDGGFIGDSLIYRRACKLVKESKSVIFASQYCPNGKLSRLLNKTDSKLYFNSWHQANSLNALYLRVAGKITGNKTLYQRSPYLHCKFIIGTLNDGTKIAITGSHNFAAGGNWLGTREIALETHDPHIIKQLEKFVENYVA